MKRILFILAAFCYLSNGLAFANESASFVKAVIEKCVINVPNSAEQGERLSIILNLDSNMNPSDRMGIVFADTIFYQSGLRTSRIVFDLDSFPQLCIDSLDSLLTLRYVVPSRRVDTTFTIPYTSTTRHLSTESTSQIPCWLWWVGGSVILLLMVGGIFLCLYLKKKKSAKKKADESSIKQLGTDDDDSTNNAGFNKEIERLKKQVNQLEADKTSIKQKTVDEAEKKLKKEQEKWEAALEKKQKNIDELTDKLNKEKDKVKSIREEVIQEKKVEIDNLKSELDNTEAELKDTKKSLADTQTQLQKTQSNLSDANSKIDHLNEAQQQYAEKITFAPYAEKYALLIQKLFEIETHISEGVTTLSKKDLEDPYHMFKATHLFRERLAEIDMQKFMVEVEMAAEKQMTFTGNGIAHLSTLNGAEQAKQVRVYFVLNYLSKYVSALQIYVESLIGLHKLMEDVSPADIQVFKNIRQQLVALYEQMEIKVICPQLFDSIGNNMDLRIEQVDAGFESGDILEIMTCLVYSIDGQTPTDKIYVKAQQ